MGQEVLSPRLVFQDAQSAGPFKRKLRYQLADAEFERLIGLLPGDYRIRLYGDFSRSRILEFGSVNFTVQQPQKLPQTVFKVGVIGSCVTRDNFNSRVASQWQSRYELTGHFYQMSFISLFSKPINIDKETFSDLDVHSRICTIRDFTKEYLTELKVNPPDLLIIDFRTDVRFPIVEYGDSYFTDNSWKIGHSSFYRTFINCKRVSIRHNNEDYIKLFEKACFKFKKFSDKYLPNTRIILNSTRAVKGYRTSDSFVEFSPITGVDANPHWDALESVFLELIPAATINAWDPNLESDKDHIWGAGPVHYEKLYYERFDSSLRAILGEPKTIVVAGLS